jgi:hypothetical protein
VAVVARGPGAVLAGLVAVVLATPVGVATAALVAVATWLRWGSAWLVSVTGAQAVLGAAGVVGPPSAAASSWLAAVALVVAVPGGSALAAVASGAAAALLVAGPAGVDGIAIRVAATAVATLLALVVGRLRWRRVPAVLALVLAAAAVGFAG